MSMYTVSSANFILLHIIVQNHLSVNSGEDGCCYITMQLAVHTSTHIVSPYNIISSEGRDLKILFYLVI